jgi:hypothetical protein
VRGPLFNDFDVGSYLIHYLYPTERVFVDNRPEAYPARFWDEVFTAAQLRDDVWANAMGTYGFESVVLYRGDLSESVKTLATRLMSDPGWALVHVDEHALVFARRGGPNQPVIDRHEIPPSRFGFGPK